jgi:3-oxoacyl-[acyl-carrier protein] reductase
MTEFAPPTDPATFVPDRFAGQGMLVTGAAGGMGLARATHAAREGAAMVLADIDAGAAEAAAGDIASAGGRAIGIGADITSREHCARR